MKDYSELFESILTTQDAISLESELDQLERAIYKTEIGAQKALDTLVSKKTADAIKDRLLSGEAKKVLAEIRSNLSKLKKIEITIAFEPSQDSIAKIHEWLTQNITKDILLDISIDKSIIGGIILVNKGKYVDLSLKTKLHEYFS